MKSNGLTVLIAATLAPFAAPAVAQDYSLDPAYGTVTLGAGFPDDPHVVALSSGGSNDASALGSPCVGYVASAPDVRLNYTSGSYPLVLSVLSDADTTLVVNGPDGNWYCNDDGGTGTNPLLAFDYPQTGQYDIWVGTYGSSDLHDAHLYISEVAGAEYNAADIAPDPSLYPTHGSLSLTSGFRNDPYTIYLQSGGPSDASLLGSPCVGFVDAAADFRLYFSAGKFPLYFNIASSADTTLVVRAPNGTYYCDDDGGEGLNPLVWFTNPQSGDYSVWVGTYGSTQTNEAQLRITELGAVTD